MQCALTAPGANPETCLREKDIEWAASYLQEADSLETIKAETGCTDDKCIIERTPAPEAEKAKLKRELFKPPTVSFSDTHWLSNTEIDTIMSQLRCKFPGFAHGFMHMIDLVTFNPSNIGTFDYPVLSLTDTDFPTELKNGLVTRGKLRAAAPSDKNATTESATNGRLSTCDGAPLHSYGVVCNTDSSAGTGRHWFAIFISTDHRDPSNTSRPWIKIECFNSTGGGSGDSKFKAFWLKEAIKIGKATGLRCTYSAVSSIQHQRSDTGNCGSYALFYIYARLHGAMPEEFDSPSHKLLDEHMRKFREVCFQLKE